MEVLETQAMPCGPQCGNMILSRASSMSQVSSCVSLCTEDVVCAHPLDVRTPLPEHQRLALSEVVLFIDHLVVSSSCTIDLYAFSTHVKCICIGTSKGDAPHPFVLEAKPCEPVCK